VVRNASAGLRVPQITQVVLGLNFGTHDAAAAIVSDGCVIAAAEEERFTRVKHVKAFPVEAIRYCLGAAGMKAFDLERVALYTDPKLQLLLPAVNLYHGFPASLRSFRSDLDKYRKRRALPRTIRRSGLFASGCRIVPVPHHLAHAASAYLPSPFEDALVITLDGRGEYETACVYEGQGGQLYRRHHLIYPHSVGYLYSSITRYLGFRPQRDEYKIMGLAAYGSPSLISKMERLASFDSRDGRLRLDLRYFDHHCQRSEARCLYSPALVDLLGPPRSREEEITDRHRDIAFALQRLLERLILDYLAYAQQLVPRRTLCLAGGIALNCVVNEAILASGRFDAVYIQPAAGDAGTSLGAALLAAAGRRMPPRAVLDHAFLGPSYDDRSIAHSLRGLSAGRYEVRPSNDPCCEAAHLLHRGKTIGWFQGPMEFGPRALGARCILAAAQDRDIVARINMLIKRREIFRPLAPAVLAEAAADYFGIHHAGALVYPFMLATAPVRPSKRNSIPAVVHIDGSARLQTVNRHTNPTFWRLIANYRALSGIPVVLNTSLNVADEPIVCSPTDAVRTFLQSGLDALVIGRYVVEPRREG
jgi:carbamoyltransferase